MSLPPDSGPRALALAAGACLLGALLPPWALIPYTVVVLPIWLALTVRTLLLSVPFVLRWAFFAIYLSAALLLRDAWPGTAGALVMVLLMLMPAVGVTYAKVPPR